MSKTLDQMTFGDWVWSGSTGYARYEFSDDFVDENGVAYSGPSAYLEVATTIAGNVVTIPAYPNFPETEAAVLNNGVTVTCTLLDSTRNRKAILFDSVRIYTSLPSTISLSQLILANGASRLLRDDDVWTKEQVIDYVATRPPAVKMTALVHGIGRASVPPIDPTDPIVVMDNDPRLLSASDYDSLAEAVTDIGATPTTLIISTADFPSGASTTVPSTLILEFRGAGTILLTTGHAVIIRSDPSNWPSKKLFYNAAASQGTISFAANLAAYELKAAWWGVTGDDVDCTAAFRAAVAAALTMDNATLLLPAGLVRLDGALEGVALYQAVVYITNTNSEATLQTLRLKGVAPPDFSYGTINTTLPASDRGTVIKTTGSGGAIIGGGQAASANFTRVTVYFEDLQFRLPPNPNRIAIDANWYFGVHVDTVAVNTGQYTLDVTQPTNAQGIGIRTPTQANGGHSVLRNVWVQGMNTGILAYEHTEGDTLLLSANAIALDVRAHPHAAYFGRIQAHYNTTTVKASAPVDFESRFQIAQLNVERAASGGACATIPAWQFTTYDFDNADNRAKATVNYSITSCVAGFFKPLYNGAEGIAAIPLNYGASIGSCLVYKSGVQSIANATPTAVVFDLELYDNLEAHSNVTNNTRLLAVRPRINTFSGVAEFAANATGIRKVSILVTLAAGGTTTYVLATQNATSSGATFIPFSIEIAMNAGDYAELIVEQTSTAALDLGVLTRLAMTPKIPY